MGSRYLKVDTRALPPYFEQVLQAKQLLAHHQVDTVTAAVKKVGISRNTFYKYKDYVFPYEAPSNQKRITLSLVLSHEPGSLSKVLKTISEMNASVLTISQSIPISQTATVTISLDITSMTCSTKQLLSKLKKIQPVVSCYIDAEE
ncbi:MAG: ACT domain-containing protein [Solobacterium sp.]|nr:ACT domain-containing protein [Solobacterium sp.]